MFNKITCLLAVFISSFSMTISAQDISLLLKDAEVLEKQFNEKNALEKYQQLLVSSPANIRLLVKAAELNVLLGVKEKETAAKKLYFESALSFAKRAIAADANDADANYAMAMASGKLANTESDTKKIVGYVKDVKSYADKALAINPQHAKANYTLGKWHYEMATLSGLKKMAVKLLFGGMPEGNLDQAVNYLEKCKTLDPYFISNYLDLGKLYKENQQSAKAIEVLSKLVKLPTRNSVDVLLKKEGAELLQSLL